jgi:hypothetical protein
VQFANEGEGSAFAFSGAALLAGFAKGADFLPFDMVLGAMCDQRQLPLELKALPDPLFRRYLQKSADLPGRKHRDAKGAKDRRCIKSPSFAEVAQDAAPERAFVIPNRSAHFADRVRDLLLRK